MLVPYKVNNEDNCWSGVSSVKKHINKELSSFCNGKTPDAQETLFTCILYLTFWKSSFWLRMSSNDTHTTIFSPNVLSLLRQVKLASPESCSKEDNFLQKKTHQRLLSLMQTDMSSTVLEILLMLTEKIQLLNWITFEIKNIQEKWACTVQSVKEQVWDEVMNNHHGNCLLLHKLILHQS